MFPGDNDQDTRPFPAPLSPAAMRTEVQIDRAWGLWVRKDSQIQPPGPSGRRDSGKVTELEETVISHNPLTPQTQQPS